jgi:hypothetical protein
MNIIMCDTYHSIIFLNILCITPSYCILLCISTHPSHTYIINMLSYSYLQHNLSTLFLYFIPHILLCWVDTEMTGLDREQGVSYCMSGEPSLILCHNFN